MTSKPANNRAKAAVALMCLAPVFALAPMIVSAIAVRITPECTVMPNCAAGAFAYFILLTVPIGCVVFIVGLVMLLAAKRSQAPDIT